MEVMPMFYLETGVGTKLKLNKQEAPTDLHTIFMETCSE